VVPRQTVVITPSKNCPCCCHNAATARCSASSFTPLRSAVPEPTHQQQAKSTLQHGSPANDLMQVDKCGFNPADHGVEQSNAVADDDCPRRRNTTTTSVHDDRPARRVNVSTTTTFRDDDTPTTRQVDTEHRTLRSAAAWRSRRLQRDSRVDAPAEQAVSLPASNKHRRLRDIKHGAAASGGKVERAEKHQQSAAADLAAYTDQLTSGIYSSLAAFQEVQENDVIDAVRGYLQSRQTPTPSLSSSSWRQQRSLTAGRRPATAAGSRTVELRQGDVGPLSSLVVIRPATPQPHATGRPPPAPASSDGRPSTAVVTAGDDRRPALCHDTRPSHNQLQQQQRERRVVQTTETRTAAVCRTQLLNQSVYDSGAWFSPAGRC